MAVRLLFDENLAARLVADVAAEYPESAHVVAALGLRARDETIWEYAKAHGFVLVTKDEDFQRLSVWRGFPPKVVWIRAGNVSTREIAELLRQQVALVQIFVEDPDAAFLPLGRRASDA